ncbi:hypothetical protein EJB05_01208, partial [Eragrostis curvula]
MDRPLDIRTSPMTPTTASEKQRIEAFWKKRKEEIEAIEDFGERAIPMTRMKKLICAEKGDMMMTFDTPSFLTKACEIFVQELAFHSWMCAESHHPSIILESDIAEAIATTESYDFLKDILHAYQMEKSSTPCSKPTKKHYKSIYQPSTSCHPPPHQVPQFHLPQFSHYPPIVRSPLPLPLTNIHPMPLPFPCPFPLQEAYPLMSTTMTPTPIVRPAMSPINYTARGLGFFGNGTNFTIPSNFVVNNIIASGAMNYPLQVYAGATPSIPGTFFYINNMTNAFAPSYDVGTSNSNMIAHDQRMTIELDDTSPEVAKTTCTTHVLSTANENDNIDLEDNLGIEDGQQQQQHQVEDTIFNHPSNALDGTLDAVVAGAGASNAGEDNFDINWDDFEIADESWLSKFWEDVMIEENPSPLLEVTSTHQGHARHGGNQL